MSQLDPSAWPAPLDPITAAYVGIAKALVANAAFMSLVKLANLDAWADGLQKELLANVGSGNLPEVALVQGPFQMHPWGGSSLRADYIQTYSLIVVTDTMQVTVVNQIKRAVAGAFYRSPPESWLFNGANYIDDVLFDGGQDGTGGIAMPTVSPDATRGINRQCSLLNIRLSMYEPRASLPG